jgi:hypothetical protein
MQTLLPLPRAILALWIKGRVFSIWLSEPFLAAQLTGC